jgi:hypothetical protein
MYLGADGDGFFALSHHEVRVSLLPSLLSAPILGNPQLYILLLQSCGAGRCGVVLVCGNWSRFGHQKTPRRLHCSVVLARSLHWCAHHLWADDRGVRPSFGSFLSPIQFNPPPVAGPVLAGVPSTWAVGGQTWRMSDDMTRALRLGPGFFLAQ